MTYNGEKKKVMAEVTTADKPEDNGTVEWDCAIRGGEENAEDI